MMRTRHNTYLLYMMVAGLVMALSAGLVWAGSLEPPPEAMDADGNPAPTTIDGDIRFINLFDGRVVDQRTGLEWEQQPDVTGSNPNAALAHCEGLSLGGQEDWRLPERDELVSLVDLSNPGGNPDLPLGHPFGNVQSSVYWSATFSAANPSSAWVVNFGNGFVGPTSVLNFNLVWCVRGGS